MCVQPVRGRNGRRESRERRRGLAFALPGCGKIDTLTAGNVVVFAAADLVRGADVLLSDDDRAAFFGVERNAAHRLVVLGELWCAGRVVRPVASFGWRFEREWRRGLPALRSTTESSPPRALGR